MSKRWSLNFSSKPRNPGGNNGPEVPAPPGYSLTSSDLHTEASGETEPALRAKRSWDLALGPIKQAPMNLFIMYMSGNAISIFPIMMVIMLIFRPIQTLFNAGATFRSLEALAGVDGKDGGRRRSIATLGQKITFIFGNLVNIVLAAWKCHSMGLLPTHASDWLAFADPVERVEWVFV